jgi:hypothetical protein
LAGIAALLALGALARNPGFALGAATPPKHQTQHARERPSRHPHCKQRGPIGFDLKSHARLRFNPFFARSRALSGDQDRVARRIFTQAKRPVIAGVEGTRVERPKTTDASKADSS